MKKIELNLWQKIMLNVGDNPGCTKHNLNQNLKSNYASIHETVDQMVEKGVLRNDKDNHKCVLFVVNLHALKSLKAFEKAI